MTELLNAIQYAASYILMLAGWIALVILVVHHMTSDAVEIHDE